MLANPRDFLAPVAAYEEVYDIYIKLHNVYNQTDRLLP